MNYNNKYKDLSPKETIQNVITFFNKFNYELNITKYKTEISTFYCHIELFYNKQFLLSSNGKGITEEYSLASGLCELYERYCSKIIPFSKYLTSEAIINYNLQNFNFNLDPEEKILSNNDILNDKIIYNYFLKILKTKENINTYFEIKYNNKIIGVPYISITDNSKKYIDPRILYNIYGSNGLAAGNTFEEAFIQGLSEIFERYIIGKFFYNNQEYYYNVNYRTLNKTLQKIIENIKELNKDIYILDLSYNFNLPVCLVILIDKANFSISYNFGSAPDFNIAVERCITEIYQGFYQQNYITRFQFPYLAQDINNICFKNFHHTSTTDSFIESIFNKIQNINSYNQNIYKENLSNKEFLDYYKSILNSSNTKCFYRNCSLCDNIYCIQIITDLNPYIAYSKINLYTNNNVDINTFLLKIKNFIDIIKYIQNGNYNKINLNNFYLFTEEEQNLFNILFPGDQLNLYNNNSFTYQSIKELFINYPDFNEDNINNILNSIQDQQYTLILKQYLLLYMYKKSKKYSKQEIVDFFKILNISIYDNDYKYILNKNYLLLKILIEPLVIEYNSIKFNNYIKNYCTRA